MAHGAGAAGVLGGARDDGLSPRATCGTFSASGVSTETATTGHSRYSAFMGREACIVQSTPVQASRAAKRLFRVRSAPCCILLARRKQR